MKTLIVGSGPGYEKREDTIAIDYIADFKPDIVVDIRKGIPLEEKFDLIEAFHILEHIQLNEDYIFVMSEFHRLLNDGGILDIRVPHFESNAALASAEHTRFFSTNSFMDFYTNPYAKEMRYPEFKLESCEIETTGTEKTIRFKLKK